MEPGRPNQLYIPPRRRPGIDAAHGAIARGTTTAVELRATRRGGCSSRSGATSSRAKAELHYGRSSTSITKQLKAESLLGGARIAAGTLWRRNGAAEDTCGPKRLGGRGAASGLTVECCRDRFQQIELMRRAARCRGAHPAGCGGTDRRPRLRRRASGRRGRLEMTFSLGLPLALDCRPVAAGGECGESLQPASAQMADDLWRPTASSAEYDEKAVRPWAPPTQ